jgi:hypothetical protein
LLLLSRIHSNIFSDYGTNPTVDTILRGGGGGGKI